MTRRKHSYARICLCAALAVAGLEILVRSVRASDEIVVKESTDIPRLKLDKCPVSRSNFDSLRIGTPEYAIFDAMPCGKGEVIREYNVGFGRQIVEVRVWKFPRDVGGFLVVTTTGGDVSSKQWE